MIVKPLNTISFDTLVDCFLKAFENYFVPMPTDKNYYKQRWQAAKVNYELSFGMFDDDKLIGFIIHAIDKRGKRYIAFNTGTGVIPEYRGQGIVNRIYEYALPILESEGITHSVLEVISENVRAIKAYEKVGFSICKNFPCFKGTLSTSESPLAMQQATFNNFDWKNLPNQNCYSWDNHYNTIQNSNYHYFQYINNNKLEAYLVLNPETGYISQIDVLDKNAKTWDQLLAFVSTLSKDIRIVNVDDRLTHKIDALKRNGLENYVSQLEMEMAI